MLVVCSCNHFNFPETQCLDNVFDWAVGMQDIYSLTTSLRLTLLVRKTFTPDQHEVLLL
jgi:hypothetical protein